MLRKMICGSALAVVMACPGMFAAKLPAPQSQNQQQQQQQKAQAKTVSGTVTAIGSDHKSFSMDINDQATSKAKKMDFYIDRNTQVQGRVGIGTKALVQYEPTNSGRNLALNIAPVAGQ
ncbi:MAG: hypothetical protein ACRD4R_04855 [Candidatus Acidiferrales bacterium]